jgi:hypothetical protein
MNEEHHRHRSTIFIVIVGFAMFFQCSGRRLVNIQVQAILRNIISGISRRRKLEALCTEARSVDGAVIVYFLRRLQPQRSDWWLGVADAEECVNAVVVICFADERCAMPFDLRWLLLMSCVWG